VVRQSFEWHLAVPPDLCQLVAEERTPGGTGTTMLTLRKAQVRDKYSGEVIGEITQDTRRDLRAKIHRAFLAKGAVRSTSFEERAELDGAWPGASRSAAPSSRT